MSGSLKSVMNELRLYCFTIAVLILFPCLLTARQEKSQTKGSIPESKIVRIPIVRTDSVYSLPRGYIDRGSENVVLDSLTTLLRHRDYEFDYDRGTVSLYRARLDSLIGSSSRAAANIPATT